MARINNDNQVLDDDRESSALERLLTSAEKNLCNIRRHPSVFPDAEQDLDHLEEAYTACSRRNQLTEKIVSGRTSEIELSEAESRKASWMTLLTLTLTIRLVCI
jgi:hypothetical protein